MKFLINKSIKVKKNFFLELIEELSNFISFDIELDTSTDTDNNIIFIDDGFLNVVDLNIYLQAGVKQKELSNNLFDLIRYYYV